MHVTCVSCGPHHAAAVTAHGTVYSWGSGERGRLGIGSEVDSWAPQQVIDLSDKTVVQVSCGTVHTLALTKLGAVFVWGGARSGKLGLGGVGSCDTFVQKTRSGQPFVPIPKHMNSLAAVHVTHISAGRAHSLALTQEGAVYTWGCGKDGKLGHSGTEAEWLPRRVSSLLSVQVIQASCGRDYTSCTTDVGWLFSWGKGQDGKLGIGSEEDTLRPTHVTRLQGQVQQVACGRHHSLAIVSGKGPSPESVALFERHLQMVLLESASEAPSAPHVSNIAAKQDDAAGRRNRQSKSRTRNDRRPRDSSVGMREPHQEVWSHQAHEVGVHGPADMVGDHVQQHFAPQMHARADAERVEIASNEPPGAFADADEGQWRYRFEGERRKAEQLRIELDELRSSQSRGGGGYLDSPAAYSSVPNFDAAMHQLQVAQQEEQEGHTAWEAGRQKKMAAAIAYHRIYQSLELLADRHGQFEPGVEQQLQEVGARLVALRGELGVEQLKNALITAASARQIMSAAVAADTRTRANEMVSTSNTMSSMVVPTSVPPQPAVDQGDALDEPNEQEPDEDPFDKSMAIYRQIGGADNDEEKRELLGSFIVSLDAAIQSGTVKPAAAKRAATLLQKAQVKKDAMDQSISS
jgi:hypothetical protein